MAYDPMTRRDSITQALMKISNPPPQTVMPQMPQSRPQMGMAQPNPQMQPQGAPPMGAPVPGMAPPSMPTQPMPPLQAGAGAPPVPGAPPLPGTQPMQPPLKPPGM
jgi:hypothetical protein